MESDKRFMWFLILGFLFVFILIFWLHCTEMQLIAIKGHL